MLELTETQKKEDFNDRVRRFQLDLNNLIANYKIELVPVIHTYHLGVFPQLIFNDKKYEAIKSPHASGLIQPEQFTKNKKSLAADKEVMERATKTAKKRVF